MLIGQAALDAVVIEGEFLMVEAKKVQDGGVKIMWGDYVVFCPHPTRSTAAIVVSRRCFILAFKWWSGLV